VSIGSIAALPAAPLRSPSRRTLFAWLILALAAASWLALWGLSASPYGRYVGHGGYLDDGAFAALCRAIPQGEFVVPALLHAGGWVLMIAAMMLPTTLPLLEMFRQITRGRADATRLAALVVAGFFVAWLAFGLVAHVADAALDRVAMRDPWFLVHGWIVGAAVLAGAGLFQFSALKYRCLEQCRTPFGFVVSRWHGAAPAREAFRLGIDHGVFCVGCCWALMLVMFVVGTASIGWMFALAALMAAEKNLRDGARLRLPIGLGLLGVAGIIVAARI
jgi:predicted metal-binding membrane protein